jgi:hypothetical protein
MFGWVAFGMRVSDNEAQPEPGLDDRWETEIPGWAISSIGNFSSFVMPESR